MPTGRSNKKRVSEAVARPVRTAAQMTPAAVVTQFADVMFFDFNKAEYTATFAFLTLVIGVAQNMWENYRGAGLFMRTVPPVEQPVAGD